MTGVTLVWPVRIKKDVAPRSPERLWMSLRSALNPRCKGILREIIVVDSCSDEPFKSQIKAICEDPEISATLIQSDEPFRFCKGRILNGGMKHAMTDYVGHVDMDIILAPGYWLDLQKNIASDKFLITRTWFLRTEPTRHLFDLGNRAMIDWLSRNAPSTRDSAVGGVQVYPTEWYRSVGGHDERFELWGSEDEDIIRRAKKSGLELVRVGKSFHIPHQKMLKVFDPKERQRWANHRRKLNNSLSLRRNEDLGRPIGDI